MNSAALMPASASMNLGAFSAASTLGAFASASNQSLAYTRLAPSISGTLPSHGQYNGTRGGLALSPSMQQSMSSHLNLTSVGSTGQLPPLQLQQHHSAPAFRQLLGSHGSHGNLTGVDPGW